MTLRLKLFGVPSIEHEGALLTGRVVQRHRLALLALLALAPDRRLSRDKLIAFLWPESGSERGRNLLKVSTYVLRSSLGEEALLANGDELRLNAELIEVDVAEFEVALGQGQPGRALELYKGPFMDGFFLSDAEEFEQWVSRERERLASGFLKALEALADAAASAKDFPAAAEWWKVRAAQDPYDSRVALRLMRALEASGNRAGALQHASIHQRLLRAEFGVESAPEVAAFAEMLRREPMPEVPNLPREEPPALLEDKAEAGISDDSSPSRPIVDHALPLSTAAGALPPRGRRWIVAGALAAVLALSGVVWAGWPRAVEAERSIVVLPFINMSADQDYEYFSDGLTEEIITRLAALPGLKVISRTSAMHYKGSNKPLPQIAGELNVDHILEGSVRQSDGRVRISAQLIDARSDVHIWAENYEYDLSDSFRVQEDIAHEVARALEVKLAAGARRLLAKQSTRDPVAHELYQRGRFLWNTRTSSGHEHAIEYYERAIERDSGYADAYAGLAHVYLTSFQLQLLTASEAETYDRLKWAAERALALDDESADAHLSFAVALQWQRNWPGAVREFRRAIELNPGDATARSWFALLLRGMGLSEEALRESRRATELDPFGVVITHNQGWHCYNMRRHECAIDHYRRTIEISPYPASYRGLGLIYAQKGGEMAAEAIRAMERAIELAPQRPDFVADLAYVLALAGRREDARAALHRAKMQPLEGFNIARAHVAFGEADSAFVWLERSNWRWPHRATRDDPALDPLRSDPRFAQLVARVEREMGLR